MSSVEQLQKKTVQQILAAGILKALEKEKFHQWYENEFEQYITGEQPDKEKILRDVVELFGL